jgi:ubiquinone/menaquinone biosynthesis C-methylase UbiE
MTRAYFNHKAAIWDETISEKDTAKLMGMVKRLNIAPGSAVLDVGTGTGVLLPFLLGEVGEDGSVSALDYAGEMLRKARAKGFDGNVDYLCADVTNIPLREGIFDIAVCYSSFPHFQDKLVALIEINRVLKLAGRLVICHTAARHVINGIHRQIPALTNDTIPGKEEMCSMLAAAGFTDVELDDDGKSYFCCARKLGLEKLEVLGLKLKADVQSFYRVSKRSY